MYAFLAVLVSLLISVSVNAKTLWVCPYDAGNAKASKEAGDVQTVISPDGQFVYRTYNGKPIAWNILRTQHGHIDFKLSLSIPSDRVRAVHSAFDMWSKVLGFPMYDTGTDAKYDFPVVDEENLVLEYSISGAGLTQTHTVNGWIEEADVALSPTVIDYDDPALTTLILLHELGHAIGLEHTTDPSSLMYPIITDKDIGKKTIDFGAIEGAMFLYAQQVWLLRIAHRADFNHDNRVGFEDFVFFSSQYGKREIQNPADLDQDGFVGFSDFALFARVFGVGW